MGHQIMRAASGNAALSPEAAVRESCRLMLRSAAGLTAQQQQLAYDVQRGRYARSLRVFFSLLEIGRHCAEPSDAVALPEVCRGYIVAAHPRLVSVGVREAFEQESRANQRCDDAQRAYLWDRSAGAADAVIEATTAQELASRAMADALHSARSRGSIVVVR